jgi:hypothetical protein
MIPENSTNEMSACAREKVHFMPNAITILLFGIALIAGARPSELKAQNSSTAVDLQVLSTSIASGSSGNTYYADTAHSIIYEVSTSGVITEINCCASLSDLSQPRGLALDGKGDLYIADTGNNRIVEVNAAQQVSLANTQLYNLSRPSGVAIDSAGDLYIADTGNNRILEIAAGGGPAIVDTGSYQLAGPTSVAVDEDGTLYISDNGNNRIVSIPASGSPALLFANQLSAPLGIVLGANGSAYIAQTGTGVHAGNPTGNTGLPAVVASFSATNMNVNEGGGDQNSIATVNITLTPLDGFNNTLYLSVLGLPPNTEMQLSHPIINLNGTTSVTETLQVGAMQVGQQSYLQTHIGRLRYRGLVRRTLILAGVAPVSLLFLIGLRLTGKVPRNANKILGLIALLVLLPATVVMASGCADNYPAGLFGSATYTATLAARTANGTVLYPLGSFGITIQ